MQTFKLRLALLAFLAGCTPEVAEWTPAESPKVNKIERTVFMHTIHYPAHENKMGEGEKKALIKFLNLNAPSPAAVNITLVEFGGHSEKRIKDIMRELVKYGIAYDTVTIDAEERVHKSKTKSRTKSTGSGVEVVIERYLVIPPACGDFSQPIGDARQAQVYSNYGCSDMANLGMMVANPRDLIKGRTLGSSDGTVIAAGVDRYRKDKVKDLIDTSTTTTPTTPTSTNSPTGATSAGGSY
ncbi:MAG: hypothetical protein JSR85_08040 [Proteobacteria bacterium]|nr:hypothetical protein [Pseudomonadota bacterium]